MKERGVCESCTPQKSSFPLQQVMHC